MDKTKKSVISAGIILISLTVILGAVERVFNPGTFVPAAVGCALIFLALIWDRLKNLKILKNLICLAFAVGLAVFFTAEAFVFSGINTVDLSEHDYAIVLGCGLYGERPSELLTERLNTAADYARKYPNCTVVLSGGQGRGEDISEAEAMRRYLIRKGIEPERLILEDKSRSTYENILNTKHILEETNGSDSADCVIISNDFHLYRAKRLARVVGLKADTLAAATPVGTVGMFLREGICVVFSWARYPS